MFSITSKYFSIFSKQPPASWVAHITRDFFTCYSCSYYKFHGCKLIRVPKVPFRSFDKFKNKIQNSILRFCFYLNTKNDLWSIRCLRASSCQVPWGFPLYNGYPDSKNPLFRKQLIYINVYIAGSYFNIWFIFIVHCEIKDTSRSSHRDVFS